MDRLVAPRAAIPLQGHHRHDEAGRAEAALRRIRIEQGLLCRMQPVAVGDALDRQDGRAVELG